MYKRQQLETRFARIIKICGCRPPLLLFLLRPPLMATDQLASQRQATNSSSSSSSSSRRRRRCTGTAVSKQGPYPPHQKREQKNSLPPSRRSADFALEVGFALAGGGRWTPCLGLQLCGKHCCVPGETRGVTRRFVVCSSPPNLLAPWVARSCCHACLPFVVFEGMRSRGGGARGVLVSYALAVQVVVRP